MSLFVRDVDTDSDVAVNAPDITADNTALANAEIPIAIGDPAVPSAMSISELMEYIYDSIATFIAAGTNISVAHDDANNTFTITSTDTDTTYTLSFSGGTLTLTPSTGTAQTVTLPDSDTQLSEEEVFDYVKDFLINTDSIGITKNDTDNEITLKVSGPVTIIDRHSNPIGSTKDGSNPDYVEITGLSLDHTTYRWYTAVCRLQEDDDDFEDGSGNDINLGWSYASTTVPSTLFNNPGEKIRVDTKDNSWAILWYQNSSTVRVFVREQDSNECKFVALYGQR